MVGITRVKLPAVTVCAPNVWTLTALLLCEVLYISTASKDVARVTLVYTIEAVGVVNAVVPLVVGAFQAGLPEIATPPGL